MAPFGAIFDFRIPRRDWNTSILKGVGYGIGILEYLGGIETVKSWQVLDMCQKGILEYLGGIETSFSSACPFSFLFSILEYLGGIETTFDVPLFFQI